MTATAENPPAAVQEKSAGESRFRAALETMLDSVIMTTAVRGEDGRIVDFVVDFINPVAEIGQRTAEQIAGRRFLDVWPSTTQSPIWGMYLHLMETGEPIVLDNFVFSEVIDGHAVTAAYDIRATRLGDGFLQNFRDVTGRELPAGRRRCRPVLDDPQQSPQTGPVRRVSRPVGRVLCPACAGRSSMSPTYHAGVLATSEASRPATPTT